MNIQTTVSCPQAYESLPHHVMDFLKSIDKVGTILVVSDCDKEIYMYEGVFSELCEFLMTETHHLKVRVGGNSYRFAEWLIAFLLRQKATNVRRFEFYLSPFEESRYRDKERIQEICEVAAVHFMSDYKFDPASDFIRYVDRYDIRGSGVGMNYKTRTVTVYGDNRPMSGAESIVMVPSMMSNCVTDGTLKDGTVVRHIPPELGLRGSLAVLWIRNEQSGFLHDGEFTSFNNSMKGAQAIADVMMAKGYEDIPPATHALYSDTWSNLVANERRLFEDAGLVCHHLIKSYEEVDEERRRHARVRVSIKEKLENGEPLER